MNKIFLAALREFKANVQTKTFWISMISFPLILTAAMILPKWFIEKQEVKSYSVIDRSGWVLERVATTLKQNSDRFRFVPVSGNPDNQEEILNKKVQSGELFAYFIIGSDPAVNNNGNRYISKNLTDRSLRSWFSVIAESAVSAERMQQKGIEPDVLAWIQLPVEFDDGQVQTAGTVKKVEKTDIMQQWSPAVFLYLLWISIVMMSQMLLMSTIEEKSNRTVEVLLSAMSPDQLMIGKILGSTATGLSVILSWVICIIIGLKFVPAMYENLPDIDFSLLLRTPSYLGSFVFYFLTGFLLYSALLVAIGSVCNEVKEAQNLWTPVMLFLIVPLMLMTPIAMNPNGSIARVMSYVPFWTPFIMMNRAGGPPPAVDYILTTIILLLSIAGLFLASGKIFRIGILMTGQPPKLRQIVKWLRTPAGKNPEKKQDS